MQLKKYIFIISALVLGFQSQAQNIMYHMRDLPQATELNPSFQSEEAFYLYLPVLSSVKVGALNTGFTIQELNDERSINKIASDILEDENTLGIDLSTTIFGFGFSVGDRYYFSYASSMKSTTQMVYPRSLLNFATGNFDLEANKAKKMSLGGLELDHQTYIENSFGLSYRYNENLTFGAALKYLIGGVSSRARINKADVTTTDDLKKVTLDAEVEIDIYGLPIKLNDKDDPSITNNVQADNADFEFDDDNYSAGDMLENTGFAFDLGASYNDFFVDNLQISASLLDLGYINWTKNSARYTIKTEQYVFEGAEVNDLVDGEDIFDNEELQEKSKITHEDKSGEVNWLSPKLLLGASYKPLSFIETNILSRTIFSSADTRTSLTLGATLYAWDFIGLTGSYSIMNGSYSNIGVGLDMKILPGFQFYVLTDNILGASMPHQAKTANIRLGINISFGDHYGNMNKTHSERLALVEEVYDMDEELPEYLKQYRAESQSEDKELGRTEISNDEAGDIIKKQNAEVDNAKDEEGISEEKKEQLEKDKKKFEEVFEKETNEE